MAQPYLDKTHGERKRRYLANRKHVTLRRELVERVTSQSATSASTVKQLEEALEDWLRRKAADEGRG